MALTRRGFLAGMLAAAAAPAVVRREWIMPLGRVLVPRGILFPAGTRFSIAQAMDRIGPVPVITGVSGGYLVPDAFSGFIDALRNRSVVMNIDLAKMPDDVEFPAQPTRATWTS
jgi:hypothetical protein